MRHNLQEIYRFVATAALNVQDSWDNFYFGFYLFSQRLSMIDF